MSAASGRRPRPRSRAAASGRTAWRARHTSLIAIVALAAVTAWLAASASGPPPVSPEAPASPDAPSTSVAATSAARSAATGTAAPEAGEAGVKDAEKDDPSPVAPAAEGARGAAPGIVIAWQPSHQGDTGFDGWEEYVICGDIVDRAIRALPEYEHVKAWDTEHGLTGSNNYRPRPTNTPAFDNELAAANDAGADVFISIHVDGGAPSGILGENMPGDASGERLCRHLVKALVEGTGLPDRGLRAVRLYSLEQPRNAARWRCLLEVGDNAADREFLEDAGKRRLVAETLAEAIRSFPFEP